MMLISCYEIDGARGTWTSILAPVFCFYFNGANAVSRTRVRIANVIAAAAMT